MPADRAERVCNELLGVLREEWKRIRTSNLGVLSGTAVVEELLMRRIQTWATELHSLCIMHETASDRLAAMGRKLPPRELQQLQVMLDQTNHPDLADYLRLMVFNTSNPAAKAVVGDLTHMKTVLLAHSPSRRARSTPSTRRNGSGGVGGQTGLAHKRHIVNPAAVAEPGALRFSGLLPDGHRLVSAAVHVLADRAVAEEAARRAAEERAARARARASSSTPDPQAAERAANAAARLKAQEEQAYRQALLASRFKPPVELDPYWAADLTETWRTTTHTRVPAGEGSIGTIFISEPVPLYEVPPEAALVRLEEEEHRAALVAAQQASHLRLGGMMGSSNGGMSSARNGSVSGRLPAQQSNSRFGPAPGGSVSGHAAAGITGSGPSMSMPSYSTPGGAGALSGGGAGPLQPRKASMLGPSPSPPPVAVGSGFAGGNPSSPLRSGTATLAPSASGDFSAAAAVA